MGNDGERSHRKMHRENVPKGVVLQPRYYFDTHMADTNTDIPDIAIFGLVLMSMAMFCMFLALRAHPVLCNVVTSWDDDSNRTSCSSTWYENT
jgi:hypothetical protein